MDSVFTSEAAFEEALIERLQEFGWKGSVSNQPGVPTHPAVLHNPDEKALLANWSDIIYENNKKKERLNSCRLTDGEMRQILSKIQELRTPMRLNMFLKGETVSITRDNPKDPAHLGKSIALDIFNPQAVAGGQSVYQIAEQPRFKASSARLNDRRGDLMLLINGMPLIHIELKRSGVSVVEACNQIQKYSHEGVFTGLFSLVQMFVAMNPEETLYFANPGRDGDFLLYHFHWADFNNEPINNWKDIAAQFLSIPMAHQMIGSYSVADGKDGTLKIMRSYQCYAVHEIADRVKTSSWNKDSARGGYIWHTTGSGKTLTSFKSAQLIAQSDAADKVIFLVDRIELGTQSVDEYRNFKDEKEEVRDTENTDVLRDLLKKDGAGDRLIVTSIQKLSNISEGDERLTAADLDIIRSKRIVIIVDECHRSTFGEMMQSIRHTFPSAMLFGFTGTPIQKENEKKANTTSDIFGDELHRYSIADGIRDKNVLPFDPYLVTTFNADEMRKQVALDKAKAQSTAEALGDPAKKALYLHYMNSAEVPMAGERRADGRWVSGIEDALPLSQYSGSDGSGNPEHFSMVVEDIVKGWETRSLGGKFHAILATQSIPEAITYYRMFRDQAPHLNVTALFDPNISNENPDNPTGTLFKEEGLVEILDGYAKMYPGQEYSLKTHAKFKLDVANRLSHKDSYKGRILESSPKKKLDLLIVVNQMLTGFDSKWLNTLYLDKEMEYEGIIQAFSRTNRIFGPDKPFGVIRYYRKPYTMKRNIERAVKLYSGDKPFALFVDKLGENLRHINECFRDIRLLFKAEGIQNFVKLPESEASRGQFAKLFKQLSDYVVAAQVQGLRWDESSYHTELDGKKTTIMLELTEESYLILALRYKELFVEVDPTGKHSVPYGLDGYLMQIDTGKIDNDYMNANFVKWLRALELNQETEQEMEQLHKSFGSLTQEQQKFAELVIHAAQSGELHVEAGKTFRDYINDFQNRGKNAQIVALVKATGVDEEQLREMMSRRVTENNINEYGRFDALIKTINYEAATAYFTEKEGKSLLPFEVSMLLDKLLRDFILQGGFELDNT